MFKRMVMKTYTDFLGSTIVATPRGDGYRFYPSVQQYILGENFLFIDTEHFDAPSNAIEIADEMERPTYYSLKQHFTLLSKSK